MGWETRSTQKKRTPKFSYGITNRFNYIAFRFLSRIQLLIIHVCSRSQSSKECFRNRIAFGESLCWCQSQICLWSFWNLWFQRAMLALGWLNLIWLQTKMLLMRAEEGDCRWLLCFRNETLGRLCCRELLKGFFPLPEPIVTYFQPSIVSEFLPILIGKRNHNKTHFSLLVTSDWNYN